MSKLLVVGLPRTGTTSLCSLMLTLGFRVAHTAYTKEAFHRADLIADTPVYSDFPQLDKLFPGAKFISLERDLITWIPSMQALLKKVAAKLALNPDHFHPLFINSLQNAFADVRFDNQESFDLTAQQLERAYLEHQYKVDQYFVDRSANLLRLDIASSDAMEKLFEFLNKDKWYREKLLKGSIDSTFRIPHLNRFGEITAWKKLRHPGKVDSYAFGPDRRKYFDYFDPKSF